MEHPQVRIFPHSAEQFVAEDTLRAWLLNGLRGRGGKYHLRSANAVANMAPGSVVFFRYGQNIVGEAVVWKEKQELPEDFEEKSLAGELAHYEAVVTFAPSSVRLYAGAAGRS